ncbi:MAG TPA: hypothetical protein DGH68_07195, partial [Bacteroidetes bacterium]|nr:hypothetical protein [Bacteroidota bacterium]
MAVLALGFTSIIAQTIVLREFLCVFSGNELVIGIVLANWMILTGAGAFLGKFTDRITGRLTSLTVLLGVGAIVPLVTIFLLRSLRNLIFPIGSLIGIGESFYGSFVLLMPWCLVAGALFTLLARIVSEAQQANRVAEVYSLESAGSVIGGICFNTVIVFFLSTFQALILLGLLNLAVCLVLSSKHARRLGVYVATALIFLLVIVAVAFNLDDITRGFMFRDQSLLFQKDTPYGNLTVTKQGEQISFFENSVLLFSSNDVPTNEEAVHYAMVQHHEPKAVLIVSGDIAGMAGEVLKYGVTQVDFVEINPWLIEVQKRFASAPIDPRIHFVIEDARRYLRHASTQYDVVLL